ncbi:MAG: hypothetical protein RLZZ157_1163 [Pseudomonadota bacterium]|jgi:iron complex outermembrane receptor protein
MAVSLMALAMAQALAPQTIPSAPLLEASSEVVIVRGQRERASTLPASVVTLDPGAIATLDDVALDVPGVWMVNDQDPGTNILSIRGATTDRLQQASVAVVLDGLPLADTELFTARLFDVAHLEVLKGPQGALYGKNASGGVIAIVQQAPRLSGGDLAAGYVQGRLGDGGLRELEMAKSFGLGTKGGVRVAGLYSDAEGWITNTTLNKKVDASRTGALRVIATGRLMGFDVDVRSQWLEEEGGAAWASSNNVTGKTGGRLSRFVLTRPIGDFEGHAWRRWAATSARATRSFSSGDLSLLLGRDSYQKRWQEELDYRPGALTFFGFPAFPNGIQPIAQPIDIRATTFQARWNGAARDTFSYQIGVFGQNTDKDRIDDFGPLLFGAAASAYATRSEQIAIHGGMSFRPKPALLIEVQARHDNDARRQTITNSATQAVLSRRSGTFARTQPRVAASYQISQNLVAYASFGQAFRPGGFNPAPAATSIWQIDYRPELTSSTEVGFKAHGLPAAGLLEVAAYANDVTDFQSYGFLDNQSVTLNVDKVTIKGFEMRAAFTPVKALRLGIDYALIDTRIGRFIATDPLLGSPATRDYTGKALPNVPRTTAKIWGQKDWDMGQYQVDARLDVHAVGKTYFEIDNVLYAPAHTWADLSIGVARGPWALRLKGENIYDARWAISAFGQGMTGLLAGLGPDGPFDTFTINRGRRISLTLKKVL